MWNYERRLEFPVNIKAPNAMLAQAITSQYGGPDGEMGASMRYLSQRYACPYREVAAVLTDIGTEELAHLEMVAAIVHQLTKNLSMEEIEEAGFANYYVDHTIGIWPQAAGGVPFNACEFQSKGDIITDLTEDMAAEQKARSTYDNILRRVLTVKYSRRKTGTVLSEGDIPENIHRCGEISRQCGAAAPISDKWRKTYFETVIT